MQSDLLRMRRQMWRSGLVFLKVAIPMNLSVTLSEDLLYLSKKSKNRTLKIIYPYSVTLFF